MRLVKTSTALLVAVGFAASAGAPAYACEWMKNVHANASTPVSEEHKEMTATPIDPVVVARTESAPKTEPAADQ